LLPEAYSQSHLKFTKIHLNVFAADASPQTPRRELMKLPGCLNRLGRWIPFP